MTKFVMSQTTKKKEEVRLLTCNKLINMFSHISVLFTTFFCSDR